MLAQIDQYNEEVGEEDAPAPAPASAPSASAPAAREEHAVSPALELTDVSDAQ